MSGADPDLKVLKIIMAGALIGPIVVLFFDPKLGAALLLLGGAIAITASRALSAASHQAALEREKQLWERRTNSSRTIYVQLVDDKGRDLPQRIAEKRLAEAQMRAGPRDTVVGVHHRVEPESAKDRR